MSQSPREITNATSNKSARSLTTPDEPIATGSLVGRTVALVLFPDEIVPALVTNLRHAYDRQGTDLGEVIDYEYTLHSKVKVEDAGITDGMMVHRLVPHQMRVSGLGCRHQDPCIRPDGPPLSVPQSGHFIPGTWFDPSPYLISVECHKDAQSEVRGISRMPGVLGRVLQAAVPGKHEVLGPFETLDEAERVYRESKEKYDHVQYLFARRPRLAREK